MTRRNCDVIILGGDLNVEPTDLEYRIITTNSGLRDAWVSQVSSCNYIGPCLWYTHAAWEPDLDSDRDQIRI